MMRIWCLGATLAVAAWAPPAEAYVLNYATRVGNYTSDSTSLIDVPIDSLGDVKLGFAADVGDLIQITYNAECGVLGPPHSRVSIEIVIDGQEADPASGTGDAFCTAVSSTDYAWTGAVRESFYTVATNGPNGEHTVEVRAIGLGGANKWWLGDSSLIVGY